jgi:proteic killer suppression protein
MEIGSIRHKELRRFFETGNAKGLNAQIIGRLRNMLSFLIAISTIEELLTPPNFGAHELKGDRAGIWSLTVTKNWRMTFRLGADAGAGLAIEDMDLEDYH